MNKGFSLPILPILIVLIAVLAYFFGWIVLVVVVGVAALITAGTAIYDKLTHDKKCRYCNKIKEVLSAQKGVAQDRITTKHEKDYPDHMLVRTYIDGNRNILVDIDFNGEIIDWPLGASQEIEFSRSSPNPVKADPGTERDVYTREIAVVLGCKPEAVNLQASLVHDFGCADLDGSECVQIAKEIWGVTLTPNPMEVSDYTNMIKRYPNLEAIIQEAEMRASEKGYQSAHLDGCPA